MTTLYHYFNNAFTYVGRAVEILPTATVTLYDNQTTNPLVETIYGDAAGLTTKANGFPANSSGDIEFWLATPKFIRVKVSGISSSGGASTINMDFQPVLPGPADILNKSILNAIYVNDPVYSNGADIVSGAVAADTAFANAFDAALNLSTPTTAFGAQVLVPPGIFRVRNLQIPSGVVVVGAGLSTVFFRRQDSEGGAGAAANALLQTISMNDVSTTRRTNNGLANCIIHGNYAQNHNDTNGNQAVDLYTGSQDYILQNVSIYQYNFAAANISGIRGQIHNVKALGINAGVTSFSTYKPDSNALGHRSFDYGSFYGFYNGAGDVCLDCVMTSCYAEGIRTAGFGVGGENVILDDCICYNTHLGDSNVTSGTVTVGSLSGYTGGNGGSQVAFPSIKASNGSGTSTGQQPSNIQVRGLQIRSTAGAAAGALEINQADSMIIDGITIGTHAFHGIHMGESAPFTVNRITVANLSVLGCKWGVLIDNSAVNDVTLVAPQIRNCTTGLAIHGAADNIQVIAPKYKFNTTNEDITTTGTKIDILNPQATDGTAVYSRYSAPITGNVTMAAGLLDVTRNAATDYTAKFTNLNTNGFGVLAKGGTTNSHSALMVQDQGGNSLFFVAAGAQNVSGFNTKDGTSVVRPMYGLYEQGIIKAYMGLDSTDNPSFIAADATTSLLSMLATSGGQVPQGYLDGPGLAYYGFNPTTVIQSGGFTVSINDADLFVIGKTVIANFSITYASGTATANNAIRILHGLNAVLQPKRIGVHAVVGIGHIYNNTGSVLAQGEWVADQATSWALLLNGGNGNFAGAAGSGLTAAVTTGWVLAGKIMYQIN